MTCRVPASLVAQATSRERQPNIIVINLDDADVEMLSPETMAIYFPNLKRFADEGLHFTNFHVTTPLCGPSRAAFFRGQYAHNNGIRCNDPLSNRSNGFAGGMLEYGRRGYHEDDLSTWMKSAGYHTMMVGKYLHAEPVNKVPSGWDDFCSSRGANYYGTVRFTNEKNPNGEFYRESYETYRTTREGEQVIQLIERHVKQRENEQPFFMYFAPLTPHHQTPHDENGMVEQRYKELWPKALMPLSIDYLEADFSDKSTAIRDVTQMHARQIARLHESYRNRMLSMKSMDDMFAALSACLSRLEIADSTYIILTSDNGFSNGHHRMIGKGDSFDRSTHVPTYVLGPGVSSGVAAGHLLAHIDLAPTIVELGGGTIPEFVDGKSFAPLLTHSTEVDENAWRDAILIENWESRVIQGVLTNTASFAIRFRNTVYTEWANGTPEYYDLIADPFQVENRYDALTPARKEELSRLLRTFRQSDKEPDTTLSQPFLANDVQSRIRPLKGLAEAPGGVAQVEVTLRRFTDSMYWNGSDWQVAPVSNMATVTNPGQMLTSWTFPPPDDVQTADNLFEVTACATDENGRCDSEPAWNIFRFDYTRPTSTIDSPENNFDVLEKFHVKGTTSDEGGVDHLRIVIRNQGSGRYWNGESWSDEWTWVRNPVRTSGRYGLVIEDLQGAFYVSVRAVDQSGNVQSPPAKKWFSVSIPEQNDQ